jgi:TfoX/Sxy family transcriptional regulator of competence genes
MSYNERLAARIRDHLADVPGVTERKMFGGLAFMINGNMACGPNGDKLIVRVGPDAYADALAEPDAREMTFTHRPMRGFIEIDLRDVQRPARLARWIDLAAAHASSLPPK